MQKGHFVVSAFFGGYAVLVAVLIAYSAYISLTSQDKQRRDDAFRVLKLIWGTVTGATGLVAIALQLRHVGLL
jgi:choline-glycine betaine transporter